MPYKELLEWGEFYGMEPFDEQRGDLRNGMLMQLIANVNRDPKKQSTPYALDMFLPFKGVFSSDEKEKSTKRETGVVARLRAAKRRVAEAFDRTGSEQESEDDEPTVTLADETLTHMFLMSAIPKAKE